MNAPHLLLGPFVLALTAWMACAASTTPTQKPGDVIVKPAEVIEFKPGVLVDCASDRVYAMTPDDAIEALEIRSGKSLWRTELAQKPMWLRGSALLAQVEPGLTKEVAASRLTLVILDTEDPARSPRQRELDLQPPVRTSIDERRDGRFFLRARGAEDGGFVLRWSFQSFPTSGTAPDPNVPRLKRDGMLGVALTEPQIATLDLAQPLLPPDPELPSALAQAVQSATIQGRLQYTPEGWVLVSGAPGDPRADARLTRWDATSGEKLLDAALVEGPVANRYLSADRRHVLISQLLDAPTHGSLPEYRWSLFSVRDGEHVGSWARPQPSSWFMVCGERVLVESRPHGRRLDGRWSTFPRELHALNYRDGSVLWRREIRDPKLSGPLPPTR